MEEGVEAKKPRYISIADLAKMAGATHGAVYHFIRTHEDQLHLVTIPIKGNRIFVREDDAQMICALFEHPEEYAVPLNAEQNGHAP